MKIKWVKSLAAMAVVFCLILLMLGVVWMQRADQPLDIAFPIDFVIAEGSGLNLIANRLESEGVINSSLDLRALALLKGEARNIRAGEYEITPGTSMTGLLSRLVQGDVKQYRVQLIEGWTVRQALQAIQGSDRIISTLDGVSDSDLAVLLNAPAGSPEGLLFPDTYNYTAGTTDLQILRRAHERLLDVLDRAWQERIGALPFDSAYQALILASIVEKETGVATERPLIAGVFIRRLELGMRLQSDPSVIYGLGNAFSGNLTRDHLLDMNNPYNTYRHDGLPPTPIALVGEASIMAVLNPDLRDYLYFVAKGDGTHYFSVSLDEHNTAVELFQLRPTDN